MALASAVGLGVQRTAGGTTAARIHSSRLHTQPSDWHQERSKPTGWVLALSHSGQGWGERAEQGPVGRMSVAEDQCSWRPVNVKLLSQFRITEETLRPTDVESSGVALLWSQADGGSAWGYVTRAWEKMQVWVRTSTAIGILSKAWRGFRLVSQSGWAPQ